MVIPSNAKGVIISFLPNIAFGFIMEFIENYLDKTNFEAESMYFKQLYNNKLITLGIFIILLKFAKFVSNYIVISIAFLFNIMIAISDNSNIDAFMDVRKEHEGERFYKNLSIRYYVNCIFIGLWGMAFVLKLFYWYRKYFTGYEVRPEEENDKPHAE